MRRQDSVIPRELPLERYRPLNEPHLHLNLFMQALLEKDSNLSAEDRLEIEFRLEIIAKGLKLQAC